VDSAEWRFERIIEDFEKSCKLRAHASARNLLQFGENLTLAVY
jgi:hypothetical protein